QNLNPVFRSFDFSNPQETTGKRPTTTIPMQALFTLNSDFVQNQASALGAQAEKEADGVAFLHQRIFAREPSNSDRQLADSFLTAFSSEAATLEQAQTNTEWSYGWGEFDAESELVTFQSFPHWTGQRWQVQKEHPIKDSPLSYLYADRGATHPGNTSRQSAVYQWRAPEDLQVEIRGALERSSVGNGNGVRVMIVSESAGVLFDKVLPPDRKGLAPTVEETSLRKGEKIWFVVDPHENNASHDSVRWSPQVIGLDGTLPKSGLAESFSGPATPATAWSAYAHALLNTNRFLFVE
ncbi:MAG: DUF1553 domain-containing protein, partial [Verrucomicrobiota bacterium]